jgi:hypothetical protein
LLVIVVAVVVIPVPAPPVAVDFIGRKRAVRGLDVGEREDGFAAGPVRGGPQQSRPARVRAFQLIGKICLLPPRWPFPSCR